MPASPAASAAVCSSAADCRRRIQLAWLARSANGLRFWIGEARDHSAETLAEERSSWHFDRGHDSVVEPGIPPFITATHSSSISLGP